MPIPGEDNNTSQYFSFHEYEKYILNEQDIEGDHKNLVYESLDLETLAKDSLSGHIS